MINNFEQRPTSEDSDILEKINAEMQKLGSSAKWLKAPDFLPEYESLRGKKILMIDDVIGVIENNLPEFVVASDGNASFIHHTKENIEGLVKEVFELNPDIVLMDYNLANDIKGSDVTKELLSSEYPGKIVGFSSEDRKREFESAGAAGVIEKGSYDASDSVKQLAKLI